MIKTLQFYELYESNLAKFEFGLYWIEVRNS